MLKSINQIPLKILTWNILANCSCTSSSFPYIDQENLDWNFRKSLFKQKFDDFKQTIDLFCFQEIEDPQDFIEFFPLEQYGHVYYQKKVGKQGICVYYKSDRLKLLKEEKVTLKDPEGNDSNQIMIALMFEDVENGIVFNVLTVHLKAQKNNYLVREAQAKTILNYLSSENFNEEYKAANNQGIIVCGDFNADPDEETITLFLNSLQYCPFSFKTVFDFNNKESSNYIGYTTWKIRNEELIRIIDYIFVSESIKVHDQTEIPTMESLNPDKKGLPTKNFPSDHLYLGATITFD